MTPEEIRASYDAIARHWDDEEFDRRNGIAQHERALTFVRRSATERAVALDVGCGSSGRILDLLLRHGFEAEGVDISPEMLARARRRHPEVHFHQADICTWQLPRTYELISAWDSIWHVPLERSLTVLEKLCHGLAPEGVLIFTSGGIDQPDEVTNPCFGQPLYHSAPGISALVHTLGASGCHLRHLEYDGGFPDPHLYLIAQRGTPEELRTKIRVEE